MKKYYLISLMIVLFACSDKYQSLYNSAPSPGLSFNKDSVVIREKDYTNVNQTNHGILTFYCKSPNNQLNIQLTESTGKVHLMYRGTDILNTGVLLVMDSISVFCTADTAGIYAIDCQLTDRLGKVSDRQITVRAIANQKAIPDFYDYLLDGSITQSWVYQFNASATQKPDGIITTYHFLINGQEMLSSSPFFTWTFHSNGAQDIGLYVTDDLGQHSDTIHKQLLIQ
jgi:hypothetical protein